MGWLVGFALGVIVSSVVFWGGRAALERWRARQDRRLVAAVYRRYYDSFSGKPPTIPWEELTEEEKGALIRQAHRPQRGHRSRDNTPRFTPFMIP